MNSIDKLTAPLSAAGFDPTAILAIVEAVLGLIGKCPNKPAAAAGTTPPLVEKALLSGAVRTALREHGQPSDPATVRRAVAVIQQTRDQATPEERADFNSDLSSFMPF